MQAVFSPSESRQKLPFFVLPFWGVVRWKYVSIANRSDRLNLNITGRNYLRKYGMCLHILICPRAASTRSKVCLCLCCVLREYFSDTLPLITAKKNSIPILMHHSAVFNLRASCNKRKLSNFRRRECRCIECWARAGWLSPNGRVRGEALSIQVWWISLSISTPNIAWVGQISLMVNYIKPKSPVFLGQNIVLTCGSGPMACWISKANFCTATLAEERLFLSKRPTTNYSIHILVLHYLGNRYQPLEVFRLVLLFM